MVNRYQQFYQLAIGANIGDPNVLNFRFQDLDLRVGAQEDIQKTWQAAIETLQQMGVDQVNEALFPVFQHIQDLANLGTIFTADSSTEVAVGTGLKTFIINAEDRAAFAPAAFVSALTPDDLSKSMLGQTVSYDNLSGTLIINVKRFVGTDTGAGWRISAASGTDNAEAAEQAAASASASATARDAAISARDMAVSAQSDTYAKYVAVNNNAAAVATAKDAVLTAEGNVQGLHDDVVDNIASLNALYLGAHASDPTTTNTGAALAEGMMYWNTTAHEARMYDAAIPGFVTAYNPATAAVNSFNGRSGGVNPADGDYTAAQVVVTPVGGISANRVQAALAGLDTRLASVEASIDGGTFT